MDGWEVLLLSLGWVLVFEGISPLIAPERWLAMLAELTKADPRVIRAAASVLVALGLVIIWSFLGKVSRRLARAQDRLHPLRAPPALMWEASAGARGVCYLHGCVRTRLMEGKRCLEPSGRSPAPAMVSRKPPRESLL